MTPEQIQRLRELEAAATKGPWYTRENEANESDCSIGIQPSLPEPATDEDLEAWCKKDLEVAETGRNSWTDEQITRDALNAILIAEARNALTELLDDWERMRRLLQEADGYVSLMYSRYTHALKDEGLLDHMRELVNRMRPYTRRP